MKREKMIQYMDLLDEKYIVEADPANAKNVRSKRIRNTVLQIGSLAACICLLLFWGLNTMLMPEIVSSYSSNTSGSYAIPDPGEFHFVTEVMEARNHYSGRSVQYLLAVNMFDANGEPIVGDAKDAEFQRLSSLGYRFYEVEKWTYQGKGEKKYYTVIAGLFTEEELQNFRPAAGIAYSFYFITNGDGSQVRFSEKDAVTAYPTNHS